MSPTRSLLAGLALVLAGCVSATAPDDGARRHVAELEEEKAELHAERDVLDRRFDAVFSTVCPPSIEGLVLEVNPERQLVVLDKGKKDGVEVGYVFDLYRGATYRGLVRITDVQEGTCVGEILHQKSPIARGDSATTAL